MNADTDIMDQVKRYAKDFVERKHPHEAPYFDIAWETFEEALQRQGINPDRTLTVRDLREPTVRNAGEPADLRGTSTIVAPRVIRAFHILFTTQKMDSENSEILRQEMLQLLSQKKISFELSKEIVNFFLEKRDRK